MGGVERAEGPASDLRGPPRDGACLQVLELDNLDVETRAEIAERYVGYRSYPAIDPVIMQVMPLPAQQHRGAALRCCCACALELAPPPSRTNWTRLVPSSRTNRTRPVPSSRRDASGCGAFSSETMWALRPRDPRG